MKKKTVPCILFNESYCVYPRGRRVTDQDERDAMINSGEWNTGPVDAAKEAPAKKADPKKAASKKAAPKKVAPKKSIDELIMEAENLGIAVDPEWTEKDLIKANEDKKG